MRALRARLQLQHLPLLTMRALRLAAFLMVAAAALVVAAATGTAATDTQTRQRPCTQAGITFTDCYVFTGNVDDRRN